MVRIRRREAFDEISFGQLQFQFFEFRLWRLVFPRLYRLYEDTPNAEAWGWSGAITLRTQIGLTIALPTMSITLRWN